MVAMLMSRDCVMFQNNAPQMAVDSVVLLGPVFGGKDYFTGLAVFL